MACVLLLHPPVAAVESPGGQGCVIASGTNSANPKVFTSASDVSPTLQTGTVLTRGSQGLGHVAIGGLRMRCQLFRFLVNSSTLGKIVHGCLLRSANLSSIFSAADRALRSGSCSLAPSTLVRICTVSSKPSLGMPLCGGTARQLDRFGLVSQQWSGCPGLPVDEHLQGVDGVRHILERQHPIGLRRYDSRQ